MGELGGIIHQDEGTIRLLIISTQRRKIKREDRGAMCNYLVTVTASSNLPMFYDGFGADLISGLRMSRAGHRRAAHQPVS